MSSADTNYVIITAKVITVFLTLLATVGYFIMMGSDDNEKVWQGIAFGLMAVMLLCVAAVNAYYAETRSGSVFTIISLIVTAIIVILYTLNEVTTWLSPTEDDDTSPTVSPMAKKSITTRNWIRLGLFIGVFVLYCVQYGMLYF